MTGDNLGAERPIIIDEEAAMWRCIQLAKMGSGYVAPNPMVGAVLVHSNRIIGEGLHRNFGQAHAEVNCFAAVRPDDEILIRDSTLYVSLEPCVHFGKTPPCTELIIEKKIPRVVIGCRDSFPSVQGKGIARLRAAGLTVTEGLLEEPCRELNRRFLTFHEQKRPYVILKWAQSANRQIAGPGGSRVQISNDDSQRLSHKWRSEEASILVGTNTALNDDPKLSNRLWSGNHPVRMVIDMQLRLPTNLHLFDQSQRTIVINGLKQEIQGQIQFLQMRQGQSLLPQLLEALYEKKLTSVLVEGGATLLQSFIDLGLWDEARIITSEDIFPDKGIAAPVIQGGVARAKFDLGTNHVLILRNKPNSPCSSGRPEQDSQK